MIKPHDFMNLYHDMIIHIIYLYILVCVCLYSMSTSLLDMAVIIGDSNQFQKCHVIRLHMVE